LRESLFFGRDYKAKDYIKQVKVKLKGAKWFIKGDLSNSFDHIKLNTLMFILEEKLADKRFTDLIIKALKAGHFNYNYISRHKPLTLGSQTISAGCELGGLKSLLYPILVDIFLERFDNFVLSEVAATYVHPKQTLPKGARLSYIRVGDQ